MAQTKAQLITILNRQNDELITAGREIEELRLRLHLAGPVDSCPSTPADFAIAQRMANARQRRGNDRPAVPVYEWDPTVPGDFARALKLAKSNNGRCVRMHVGTPR